MNFNDFDMAQKIFLVFVIMCCLGMIAIFIAAMNGKIWWW